MHNAGDLGAVRRERAVFLAGICLLALGVPVGLWGIARELLLSGSMLVRYWEPVGYPFAVVVMHGSAVYFVWRFSRFLGEPGWGTVLWCMLASVVPLLPIPFVLLLFRARAAEKEIVDERVRIIDAELHDFLLTGPSEPRIIRWMAGKGLHLSGPAPYSVYSRGGSFAGEDAGRPRPFFCDFHSPDLRRALRVVCGLEGHTSVGGPVAHTHYALPSRIAEAEAHDQRAVGLADEGRVDEALRAFHQSIRLCPEAPNPYLNMGCVLARAGRHQEAESAFRRAVQLKPDWAQAHGNLGGALLDMGRLTEAESELQIATEIDPYYVNGHLNLAAVLAQSSRSSEARAHLLRVLELDPSNIQARIYLDHVEWVEQGADSR